MIKQFRAGSKIQHTFNRAGITQLSVSHNISGYVFSGNGINNLKQYLTEIVHLNDNIKVLSSYSFKDCSELTSMNLFKTSVDTIGSYSFQNCPKLVSFYHSQFQKSIPSYCFNGDSSLKFVGFGSYESDNSKYD